MLLRDPPSLPTWITTLDTDWATFFSEKFEKSAKKQRHICPEYYDVRAESTNYAHAPSHLIGSLCSNDEIEFQVLNNEIKYMQAIRKGPDTLQSVDMCHVRGGDLKQWVWKKGFPWGGVGRVL